MASSPFQWASAKPPWMGMTPSPYKYEQQLLHNKNLYQILDITPKAEMPQHSLWRDYALATGLKEKQSDEMFDEAAAGPWTPEDYPLVSGWVDENGPALAALISGLSRDRYFSPLVWRNNGECAYETLLPHLGHQRWLGRLLAMRGLRAIAEGDIEWAIDHLIYLHRMGKGISHEPTMIGALGQGLDPAEGPIALTCQRSLVQSYPKP